MRIPSTFAICDASVSHDDPHDVAFDFVNLVSLSACIRLAFQTVLRGANIAPHRMVEDLVLHVNRVAEESLTMYMTAMGCAACSLQRERGSPLSPPTEQSSRGWCGGILPVVRCAAAHPQPSTVTMNGCAVLAGRCDLLRLRACASIVLRARARLRFGVALRACAGRRGGRRRGRATILPLTSTLTYLFDL